LPPILSLLGGPSKTMNKKMDKAEAGIAI